MKYLNILIINLFISYLIYFPISSQACSSTVTVTATSDSGPGSLREALVEVCADGTIQFEASLSEATILLTSELVVDKKVIIENPFADNLIISGNHVTQIFSVNSSGDLTLDRVTVANGYSSGPASDGGGLYNDSGTVTVINSTFSGNRADRFGGGLRNFSGTVTVTNSTFSGNWAGDEGGGLQNSFGTVTVTNSTFSDNQADQDGGGLSNYKGTVTMTNSTFSLNETHQDGGGLQNSFGTVTVTNSTFSDNWAEIDSGGLDNVSGTVTVTNSTFSGNQAELENGGGLYNYEGTVTITNSTFSGNQASLQGGLYNNEGTVIVTNSTFSGNEASTADGAIRNYGASSKLYLINSTIFNNHAPTNSGVLMEEGELHLKNTLIAQNSNGNCALTNGAQILTNLNNLIEDGSCDAEFSGDPKLGPLQDNGGPTQTHALLPSSPALAAGDPNTCAADPVNQLDQRGIPRPSACDIGAFEFTLCVEQTQIPLQECETLVTLYERTNGSNWSDSPDNNWLLTTIPCSWSGITCSDGHVTAIQRQARNLQGSLPKLTDLPALQILLLASNQLTGEIPPGSDFPSSLEQLSLAGNQFEGEIPTTLTTLSNLTTLDLNYNKLTANTTDTGLLSFLENLTPEWKKTQTLPPTNIEVTALSDHEIQLAWAPILYQGDGGYYRILSATFPGGPYQEAALSADKSATNYLVDNLAADTTYYLVLETYTPSHGNQPNELTSTFSSEISATTPGSSYNSFPAAGNTLDFGDELIDNPIELELEIFNFGNWKLDLSSELFTGDHAHDFKIITLMPVTLEPDEGTTITLQCTPSGKGPRHAQFQLTTNDAQNPSPSYPLACEGIESAAEYHSTPFPGGKLQLKGLVGETLTTQIEIEATGDKNLAVSLISLSDSQHFQIEGLPLFIAFNDPQRSQALMISCAPSEEGLHTATLQLKTNDPHREIVSYDLECTGTTNPDELATSPGSEEEYLLNFGETPLNTPTTLDLNLTNPNESDWVIEQLIFSGEHQPDFQILTPQFLPLSITKNGGVQTITLQCQPSAEGARTATLEIHRQNLPTLNYTLTCHGGLTAHYLSTPEPGSTLEFQPTESLNLTLQQAGRLDLELDLIGLTGEHADDFQLVNSSTFPLTLAEGDDPLTLTIECTPLDQGLHLATLELSSNDPENLSPTYTLQCIEEIPGVAAYDSIPAVNRLLEVGHTEVGTPTTTTLTVLEVGTEQLEIPTIIIEGDHADDFTLPDGITSLTLPDGSPGYPLTVQCQPSEPGERLARLTLTTNDPDHLEVNYDLTCTGLDSVNHAPTDIILSANRVDEDSPGSIRIGNFSTLDPDENDTHTYLLQEDEWGVFELRDNHLLLHPSTQLDFETRASYEILVRSTDAKGLFLDKKFIIQANDIAETQFWGDIITSLGSMGNQASIDAPEHVKLMGYLKPTRQDVGRAAQIVMSYHWTPASGEQPLQVPVTLTESTPLQPQMEFTLFQGQLIGLAGVFEVHLGYRLGEKSVSAPVFTLTVQPNRPPSQIELSNHTVLEDSPANTLIGTLTSYDFDHQDEFIYGLVDDSEGHFQIIGNELRTTSLRLDYENQAYHSILVRSVDKSGDFVEQKFRIRVLDVKTESVDIPLTSPTDVSEEKTEVTLLGKVDKTRGRTLINVQLIPKAQHRGLPAELFVCLAVFEQGRLVVSYLLEGETWWEWDEDLARLRTVEAVTLGASHEVNFWQEELPKLAGPGELRIFAGYRLRSGEVVASPEWLELN